MRIATAAMREFSSRLPGAVGSAVSPASTRSGLLLCLRDETGRIGQGEASPLPGFSRETLAEARGELGRIEWAALPNVDVEAPLSTEIMRVIAAAQVSLPSARFALEIALLDLVGKQTGRPMAMLLAEEGGRASVELATVVIGENVAEAVEDAQRAVARGFRCLKRKIGKPGAFAAECEVAAAVRAAIGDHVALRLDANQAFTATELPARLAALVPLCPKLVEEPLAGGLVSWEIGASPVPIGADESLLIEGAADALTPMVKAGVLRAFVLKPAALGMFDALELARRAASLGVDVLVTHLWDGPVGLAAAGALALALPGRVLACGLDRHAGLSAWPKVDLPGFGAAVLSATDRPGLGLPLLEAP